jgi:ribonuclease G
LKFTQFAINDKAEGGFDFGRFEVEPEIVKTGKINEVLGNRRTFCSDPERTHCCKGDDLVGTFFARSICSTHPFNDIVAVSRKIHSSEERRRCRKSWKPSSRKLRRDCANRSRRQEHR